MEGSFQNIDLSIVIITWRMKDLLKVCVESIYKYTQDLAFELIIIDNNSQDGTIEVIEKNYPNVKLIKNSRNEGVAPARNKGIKYALGKYILILDADMELIENSFKKLFDFMENNNQCGLVGSKLIDHDNNLQTSCKRIPTLLSFLFRRLEWLNFVKNSDTLKYHTMLDWDHSEIREVDYVIGACQFFRRDLVDKIGIYDSKIFYGPEDLDYCIRTWNSGYKVYYYPDTSIIHHEQRITKKKLFSKITLKHFLGIFYLYKKYNFNLRIKK